MEALRDSDPRRIGPFRVEGRIGAGGMGQVYLAADQQGRLAAIKVAHPELTGDEQFRERFRREIRMAATIPGWFTAAVLGADPDADRPWLATAYVQGPSLAVRVRDGGPLPHAEVAALGARLAAGLTIVHATGLVHRDLKPANVILSAEGPRLIDFGIARGVGSATLTGTGNLMGTPSFMSPEQAMGTRDIGPHSDVFGLGTLLMFAATGASPFAAETIAGSIYRIMNTTPDVSVLQEPVREAVWRCLQRDIAARPTAAQIRDALGGGPPAAGPRPVPTTEAPTDRNTRPAGPATASPRAQPSPPDRPVPHRPVPEVSRPAAVRRRTPSVAGVVALGVVVLLILLALGAVLL